MSRTTVEIIGRDEELGSIQTFLERLPDGSRALVLSGEPGIGKTILWEAGLKEAGERSACVLLHRGAEAEASLSFTGLFDLLALVFDDAASSLAPMRRRALEVALLLAEPGEKALDPHAIGLALLDVLRALAERGPVVVALDDVQWLDSSSAGVLQIALRRLRNEPIGVLATLRKAPDSAVTLELERAFAEERLTRVSLGPLSPAALHRLLEGRLGLELTRPELIRVQEASAGNPFFALELGRELVRTNTKPTAGRTLPVSESLHELLDGRLARLPTETGDVVLFAAALARPTIELVSAAHGDPASVLEALRAAIQAGVLQPTSPASDSPIPCLRPSATSKPRLGSDALFTVHWPRRSPTSRSRPATWRYPSLGRTRSSPPTWTRLPSMPPPAGQPPRELT